MSSMSWAKSMSLYDSCTYFFALSYFLLDPNMWWLKFDSTIQCMSRSNRLSLKMRDQWLMKCAVMIFDLPIMIYEPIGPFGAFDPDQAAETLAWTTSKQNPFCLDINF